MYSANASVDARLREALARGLIGDRSEPDGYWIDIKFQTHEDMRKARSAIKAWRVDAIKKSLAGVVDEAKKSEGAESQREGQAQMGLVKTKTSPSALIRAGDHPSDPPDRREIVARIEPAPIGSAGKYLSATDLRERLTAGSKRRCPPAVPL